MCGRPGVIVLSPTACAGRSFITNWTIGEGFSRTPSHYWVVASITATCSDLSELQGAVDADHLPENYTGSDGPMKTVYSASGYSSISGRAGSFLDAFLGVGGTSGGAWPYNCPEGMVVVGFQAGLYASIIQEIRVSCLDIRPPPPPCKRLGIFPCEAFSADLEKVWLVVIGMLATIAGQTSLKFIDRWLASRPRNPRGGEVGTIAPPRRGLFTLVRRWLAPREAREGGLRATTATRRSTFSSTPVDVNDTCEVGAASGSRDPGSGADSRERLVRETDVAEGGHAATSGALPRAQTRDCLVQ